MQHLVRERLGAGAAGRILWSNPRVICVAGDFTRYDVHAVREHRRGIDKGAAGASGHRRDAVDQDEVLRDVVRRW